MSVANNADNQSAVGGSGAIALTLGRLRDHRECEEVQSVGCGLLHALLAGRGDQDVYAKVVRERGISLLVWALRVHASSASSLPFLVFISYVNVYFFMVSWILH